MSTKKKLLQAAAGSAGGAGLDIEEVFNTNVYRGNDSTNTITNNIDLSTEGGIVWFKKRAVAGDHSLYMTDLGNTSRIIPNETNALLTSEGGISSFNTDGFTLNNFSTTNGLNVEMCAWTFRKAPKFFDVVTYTGDRTQNPQNTLTLNHNLGSTPGMIIVKCLDDAQSWAVYHRTLTTGNNLFLNLTSASGNYSDFPSDPTSTTFTVGSDSRVNFTGRDYVAYLFAHNNGDGDFGPDSDQDIIKCGSYTGNGSTTGPSINLGFEPQWIMYKRTDTTSNWHMLDTMRGWSYASAGDLQLYSNLNNAENQDNHSNITPTGFDIISNNSEINASGGNYVYIAIRRGTLNVPEDATKVFDVIESPSSDALDTKKTTGFPVDLQIFKATGGSSGYVVSRSHGVETRTSVNDGKYLYADSTAQEGTGGSRGWDSTGFRISNELQGLETVFWNWKRAPGYLDTLVYTGTGSNQNVKHGLGVVPEMVWIKKADGGTGGWVVGFPSLSNTAYGFLNDTDAFTTSGGNAYFVDTAWSDQYLYLRTDQDVNGSGGIYVAYLFASVDGVSKVGSYTGNGTSQTIDCGFSAGARFVLIKRTDDIGNWLVVDTERGLVSGNDPVLLLDATNAEQTNLDIVDPTSSGFIVNGTSANWNASGGSYIFYAIA